MTKTEFYQKREEILSKIAKAEDADKKALVRELELLNAQFNSETAVLARENVKILGFGEQEKNFREFLKNRKAGSTFELKREVVGTKTTDIATINHTTVDVLDKDFDDKVIYTAAGCPVQKGAVGISDWGYAGGVQVKVANELTSIGDAQKLDISKISAVQNRLTAKVIISNQAIENTNINLVALALSKIDKAYADAINFAATATVKYGANFYGGFAHANAQKTTYTDFTFAKAMEIVGLVAAKNYEASYGVFVMGPADYYALKAKPKDAGSGLMVIDDYGRLGGFPVFVSNSINRASFKGAANGHNIGFGLFNYLPCLQHGNLRLSIDAVSSDAADVDGVIMTCNADWSMTDLYPDAFVVASKGSV